MSNENMKQEQTLTEVQPSASVRFTEKVLAEFGSDVGDIALTN